MELYKRLQGRLFNLGKTYSCIAVLGPDAKRFLNGQLTNDVEALGVGEFQLQSRLDRTGKIKSFFYLGREQNSYLIFIPKNLESSLKEDLEKFIIMDDVELNSLDKSPWLLWNYHEEKIDQEHFNGVIAEGPCILTFEKPQGDGYTEINDELFNELMIIQGEPLWGVTVRPDQLVTDTVVNLNGVSLSKGCFLGQETVSKIETRRGGAYFPVLLKGDSLSSINQGQIRFEGKKVGEVLWQGKVDGESIIVASLLRDYRIEGRVFRFEINDESLNTHVSYLPLFKPLEKKQLAESLFEHAVKVFQYTDEATAVNEFEEILKIDPTNEDSFEAIGVIFGRMEKFKEGIAFMDKVLEANPDSIMAHTNKSLFYMRLGEIEKAEEEKAQATVKSFSQFGKEAQEKKKIEELKKQEEEEINRRFGMFQQVLELDPEDALANYGLADIYYQRNEAEKSIPLLEKVLETDPKYSVGYLLLGKCLIEVGDIPKAKEVFEKGIGVASKLGDLMPANEMQAKLVSLN